MAALGGGLMAAAVSGALAAGEWARGTATAGADGELQRRAVTGEPGQPVKGRPGHLWADMPLQACHKTLAVS